MSTIPAGPDPSAIGSGIVDVEEFRTWMGNPTWTAAQLQNAAATLLGVQGELEDYLNRTLSKIQVRETIQTDKAGYLNTRYSPVLKVIGITGVDQTFDPELYSRVDLQPMVLDPMAERVMDNSVSPVGDPLLVPGGIYHGIPDAWYVVEYIAGYTGPTDSLKKAIMTVAQRGFAQNNDDAINFRGDQAETVRPADNRTPDWTEDELKKFKRLRRRVMA